jgi:hypothetical protein
VFFWYLHHFVESFGQAFSKACEVKGQSPLPLVATSGTPERCPQAAKLSVFTLSTLCF